MTEDNHADAPEPTREHLLDQSYPRPDGEDADGSAFASSEGGDCDACPHGDGSSIQPSIYQRFWQDARAELRRRDYAKVLATVGGFTALGSLVAPVSGLTQVFDRKYEGPVYSDGIALVDADGNRIEEGRLKPGEQLTVFPEARPGIEDAPTILVRFEEDVYGGDVKGEYTVGGYAAFSKVCTHAGCMVADRDGDVLVCPCHSGRFDPTTGASVVGGPPPRGLPQLPITVSSDGYLVATGDFDAPVGAGGG
ncbi:Rieske (2Fe-2S) protein [Halorubellus litoreus]|uniref:Ubiquinol-cytochrome c reductase iron-sulfur subunit n=1 Tax=Halorubellus litoreus TaxID=755308 RepID=A0ABD5VFZ2_9EURY